MMHIGFDAKRIFYNRSGLGNYSRSTVELLLAYAPEHQYFLFTPSHYNGTCYKVPDATRVIYPSGYHRWFPYYWRSYHMHGAIQKSHIDIYHGLSNEIPADIRRTRVKSIVTLHDLIFLLHPEYYHRIDRWIYTQKYLHSCKLADRIIAISQETARHLTQYFHIDPARISVVYQGCHPQFLDRKDEVVCDAVRLKYQLPNRYILNVGTIEPRKNLLLVVQAMAAGKWDFDLVACGKQTPYENQIMDYAMRQGIAHKLHFLHHVDFVDLPAIYQMSRLMVYPSLIEGFGIPILEGLSSHTPVITTQGGVFGETGGDACYYVDPHSVQEMQTAIDKVLFDDTLRASMIQKGKMHIQHFTEPIIAQHLIDIYQSVLG